MDLLPDLCDHYPQQIMLLPDEFKSFGEKPVFYGEVVTVKCFRDNSKVADTLLENGKGKVLVVDGGGAVDRSLLGDNLAQRAIDNNWAGIVVVGAIRDVFEINAMPIGVKALATCPMKTEKRGQGEVNVQLSVLGIEIEPGMHLYADLNGVVVSSEALSLPTY